VALQAVVEAREEMERMAAHPQIASAHCRDESALTGSRAASSRALGKRTIDASSAEGSLAQPDPARHPDATDP